MGRSRVKRGLAQNPKARVASQETMVGSTTSVVPPIPDVTGLDMAFGNTAHLPAYATIPDDFKRSSNRYAAFVSRWFFGGIKQDDLTRLIPREGVEKGKALAAIRSILVSFDPKHEHKEAGCAFLLHAWFDLRVS